MAKLSLEEAAQLGLLDPETANRLGYSPFSRGGGGSPLTISPGLNFRNLQTLFRYPGLGTRSGIQPMRFGAGYAGGMTLSPESPNLGLAGIAAPVGRINSSGAALAAARSRGIAGGIAGNAAEGSGNLTMQPRVQSLPDGRRLVTYPDGRRVILPVPGSGGRPMAAESPEGQAELAALGMAGQGVGIAQQLARLVGDPARPRGGQEGPGLVMAAPGGPAGLALGPDQTLTMTPAQATPAELELGMNSDLVEGANIGGPSILPQGGIPEAALGELGINTAATSMPIGAPPVDITGRIAPEYLSQFQPLSVRQIIDLVGPTDISGRIRPEILEQFRQPTGQELIDLVGMTDISGRIRPEILDRLGFPPADIMGAMPAPAAGPGRGRDLDPRGMGVGPSQGDLFGGGETGAGGGGLNVTPSNTLGLLQSLLGTTSGALANNPMAIVQGLMKSGMSIADIGKIPGLAKMLTAAGAPVNLVSSIMKGDIPAAVAAAPGLLNTLGTIAPQTFGSLASSLGLTTNQLSALGGVGGLLGGGYGLYNAIEQGNPLSALMSGAQMYSAGAPIINTLSQGAINLPSLSSAAISALESISPGIMSILSGTTAGAGVTGAVGAGAGLGSLAGSAAQAGSAIGTGGGMAGAGIAGTAGGVGGAVGGTVGGAAAGSMAAGLAAAVPGLVMAAMSVATGLYSMFEQQALGEKLTGRFENLTSSIPGHIAAFQRAPGLLMELSKTSDPKEAARLYGELEGIARAFNDSGMEDFLKQGYTRVTGSSGQGDLSAAFPQGKELAKALGPLDKALTYGRMVAQDKAAQGGIEVPGARSAEEYALALGGPDFNKFYRPAALLGSGEPGQGYLLDLLGGQHAKSRGNFMDPNDLVDQATLNLLGRFDPAYLDPANQARYGPSTFAQEYVQTGEGGMMVETGQVIPGARTGGYTNQDVLNSLERGAGAGILNTLKNDFDLYGSAYAGGVGKTYRPLAMEIQALKSGSIEQGLRDIMAKGGWTSDNPYFAQAAAAPPPAAAPAPAGPMAFDPLGFLSSLEQGQRVRVNAAGETLDFVPYKAEGAPDFGAKDSGYSEISAGSGIYAKPSGQQGGLEVYVPQDRAKDLGKGLVGAPSPGSQALAAALGAGAEAPAASGQEAGATPGAGPAADIAPVAPAQGQAFTGSRWAVQGENPYVPGIGNSMVNSPVVPTGDSTPTPGTGSFKKGGTVPATGTYRLHRGEVVVPAARADEVPEDIGRRGPVLAHHEESETTQDADGRWINVYGRNIKGKAGQPLPTRYPYEKESYDTVVEAETAARRRSQDEGKAGRTNAAPGPWYVNLTEGTPTQEVDDPTDPKVRRLAFGPADVREALENGEAPILIHRNVLNAPPSVLFNALRAAERRQNTDAKFSPAMVAMNAGAEASGDWATAAPGPAPRRFPGDRGRGADVPLENAARDDMGGQDTGNAIRQLRPRRELPPMPRDPGLRPRYPMSTSITPAFGQVGGRESMPTLTALDIGNLLGKVGLGGPRVPPLAGPDLPTQPQGSITPRQGSYDEMLRRLDEGSAQPSTLEESVRFQRRHLAPDLAR